MTTLLAVSRFEVKSHNSPDEVRSANKARLEIARLEALTLARFTLEPGWRWSESIKPIVKTDTCQLNHVGYCVSGRLTIRMNNGTQKTINPGDSYTIPPGHEAWVEGNERFVGIEMMSAEQMAKPAAR